MSVASRPSAAESEALHHAVAGLPPYPGAHPLPAGPKTELAGTTVELGWFETNDPVGQVLGYYEGTFLDAGYPIVGKRYGDGAGYTGYRDPQTHELHLISAMQQGQHTLVFPSRSKVTMQGQQTPPPELSLPEGAQRVVVMTSKREGAEHVSVFGVVPNRSEAEVLGFYRSRWAANGFAIDDGAPSGDGLQLSARKDAAAVRVLVRKQPGHDVEVFLNLDQGN